MCWLQSIIIVVAASSLGCGRGDEPAATVEAAPDSAAPYAMSTMAAGAMLAELEADTPVLFEGDERKAELMGWTVLAPEGGGFRMEVPLEPTYTQKTVSGSAGLTSQLQQWNVSDSAAGTFYVIATAPLVEQLVKYGDSSLALDRVVDSIGNSDGMRVDATRKITLNGFEGRQADVTIHVPGGGDADGRLRLYLVGLRLYQILGAWSDESGRTQAEKLFMSFELYADVVAANRGVDLWRRFPAPGDALDIELPGAPDRSVDRRDTPFGPASVASATLLSAFPPAVYGVVVTPLAGDDVTAPVTSLYDRWEASLDTLPTRREKAMVLGQPARRLHLDRISWLVFVHTGSFYELRFQPIVVANSGDKPEPPGDHERERFFASPRVKPPTPVGAP